MQDPPAPSKRRKPQAAVSRAERQAAALRTNLARRKAQARARKADAAATDSDG